MRKKHRRFGRPAVLAVLHADGWVELYGDKDVDIHMVVKPYAWSPEMGRLAEEWLDLTLKPRYRSLYFPGRLREAAQCERLLPSQICEREVAREYLAAVNDLKPQPAPEEEKSVWSL